MSAGRVITTAYKAFAGTAGAICLALERKKPIPRETLIQWATSLRTAADQIDTFVKTLPPPKE